MPRAGGSAGFSRLRHGLVVASEDSRGAAVGDAGGAGTPRATIWTSRVQCVSQKMIPKINRKASQMVAIFLKGNCPRLPSVVIGPRSSGRGVICES